VTTFTEMTLSGRSRAQPAMVTRFSTDGSKTRGTVNNCANGYTPWGTYLTCEENWNGYFRRVAATDNPKRTAKEIASLTATRSPARARALGHGDRDRSADTSFARWNARSSALADGSDDFRNVANTYGWVVEIDPFNAASMPKKRTALGRFAHEGAWPAPVRRQAARLVHGRRLARRVHLQVRLDRQLGCRPTRRAASPRATSTSTTASSTWRSSPPTAAALARAEVRHERHHRGYAAYAFETRPTCC
jgi:hypothetical protein